MKKTGFIYILTNPSFPQYVKIGYATDVKQRLDELNRSTAVPFAFRVYATYEVDSALSDKKLHSILDKLNPELRSTEEVDGKRRIREFYAMTPEDAYSILEAIAEIHGCSDKLKLATMSEDDKAAEETAEEIATETQEKAENFSFSKCQIPVGAILEFGNDPTITCTVVDDRMVEYNGKKMYLTGLAKQLLGKRTGVAGPRYFKYNGEWLNDIRHKIEK